MKMYFIFLLTVFAATGSGQRLSKGTPPAFNSIRETDLKSDLYFLASDSMHGRRAGTVDELKAAGWMAEQARRIGLQPGGADGSYFQFFNIKRTTVATSSQIRFNGKNIPLWKDAWVTSPVSSKIEGAVTWLPAISDTANDVKGKVVAMKLLPPAKLPATGISLWVYRYVLLALRQQGAIFSRHGAAALIVVADTIAESEMGFIGQVFKDGLYQLEQTVTLPITSMPVILVHSSHRAALQERSASVNIELTVNSYLYPSVNVIAKARGTEPVLKKEYVLFSGHHDHDGVGSPVAGDSIWNGADDNASVSVALLGIARAWVRSPARRSALFVWHGAEERGLLGSRWLVGHPTVPKEAIVAVLNGDMMGRNAPDSAALLGAVPPHRNSIELVNMAFTANKNYNHFKIDTSWDAAEHPENWYFRSDHLPYAQAGIPAIFFTSLLHPDYHTPRDEPNRIDIKKLAAMTRWMYATGWLAATNPKPRLDLR